MLFLYGIYSMLRCEWELEVIQKRSVNENWTSFKREVQNEVCLSLQSLINYYSKISCKVYITFAHLLSTSLKYTAFSPLITCIVENTTLYNIMDARPSPTLQNCASLSWTVGNKRRRMMEKPNWRAHDSQCFCSYSALQNSG